MTVYFLRMIKVLYLFPFHFIHTEIVQFFQKKNKRLMEEKWLKLHQKVFCSLSHYGASKLKFLAITGNLI